MSTFPCLERTFSGSGQVRFTLGDRLTDRYLEFVAARCRPDTLRAVAFDLKAFFAVVGAHEIIDHSGIDLDLPLLSRSLHHDEHHRRSNCYYGQLLPVLDRAHGSVLVDGKRSSTG